MRQSSLKLLHKVAVGSGRSQLERPQLLDQPLSGRMPAAAPGSPAFINIIGQNFNIVVKLIRRDRLHGRGIKRIVSGRRSKPHERNANKRSPYSKANFRFVASFHLLLLPNMTHRQTCIDVPPSTTIVSPVIKSLVINKRTASATSSGVPRDAAEFARQDCVPWLPASSSREIACE